MYVCVCMCVCVYKYGCIYALLADGAGKPFLCKSRSMFLDQAIYAFI